jgi:hypothetical protein
LSCDPEHRSIDAVRNRPPRTVGDLSRRHRVKSPRVPRQLFEHGRIPGRPNLVAIVRYVEGRRRRSLLMSATFTVGFDNAVYDERPRARLAASHFLREHLELVVDMQDFLRPLV